MIRKVSFESYERRINQVLAALKENGINSIEEANEICEKAGVDPYQMCEETQRICFENAKWAYVCGAAIAIKKGVKSAAEAAEAIGMVWVTVTWLLVCCARRLSASPSWLVTSHSLLPRVPSRLPRRLTRCVKSPSALF